MYGLVVEERERDGVWRRVVVLLEYLARFIPFFQIYISFCSRKESAKLNKRGEIAVTVVHYVEDAMSLSSSSNSIAECDRTSKSFSVSLIG